MISPCLPALTPLLACGVDDDAGPQSQDGGKLDQLKDWASVAT